MGDSHVPSYPSPCCSPIQAIVAEHKADSVELKYLLRVSEDSLVGSLDYISHLHDNQTRQSAAQAEQQGLRANLLTISTAAAAESTRLEGELAAVAAENAELKAALAEQQGSSALARVTHMGLTAVLSTQLAAAEEALRIQKAGAQVGAVQLAAALRSVTALREQSSPGGGAHTDGCAASSGSTLVPASAAAGMSTPVRTRSDSSGGGAGGGARPSRFASPQMSCAKVISGLDIIARYKQQCILDVATAAAAVTSETYAATAPSSSQCGGGAV